MTSLSAVTSIATEERYLYELAPLHVLPEVDLTISVKSRFIKSRRIHRLLHLVAHSPLTFLGYIASLGIAISVFYVPAPIGRILSLFVVVTGLPGALISLGNLRFGMVAVMFKTYDVWFFGSVSTLVSIVLGMLLDDTRALLMLTSWLSFITNICVDATVLGLRQIWFANVVSVFCYGAMACAISMGATDELKMFDLVHINGHRLPAAAVVRDSVITIIIAIARNVVRKHTRALGEDSASTVFRCVSFRCRLQLRAIADTDSHHDTVRTGNVSSGHQSSHFSTTERTTTTQLRFESSLPLIDVRNTLVHMHWLWRIRDDDISSTRKPLPWIGFVGFTVTNILYVMEVACPELSLHSGQPTIIILATAASTIFVGITAAAMHRQLLQAVVTSFDFMFIASEITIVHIALADILEWRTTTVIALLSDLQWCIWILCWDAITPPVRRRLGVSRRLAACVGPALIVVLACVVVIVFAVKSPDTIRDRVVYRFQLFGHAVEFRALTWYFSCAATISSWAIRIMWRLWMASEAELVVLDGTVVYQNYTPSKSRAIQLKKHRVGQAPSLRMIRNAPPRELNVLPSG